MTTQPSVQTTGSGPCLIVQLEGEMDHDSAPFFRERLAEEIARGHRCVVLELSAVSFCDSAGLNVLLRAWQRAGKARAVLVLASVPEKVQRMLSVTGMDTVVPVYATVAEAEGELAAGAGD